jgi:hypothetical protein
MPKAAAKKTQCSALLRSGGVQGNEQGTLQSWADTVHDLRHKGYQLDASASEATTK